MKISLTGFALLIALGFLSATATAQDKLWLTGSAKVSITPKEPMWMSGYASRTMPATGKVHDLWSKALVLKAPDGKRIVLVTLDLVGIGRDIAGPVTEKLRARFRLERSEINLAVSHTHSGPVVGQNLNTMYFLDDANQKRVRDYTTFLETKILDVVEQAHANLSPSRVAWGRGLTTFATNRRNNPEKDIATLRAEGRLVGPVDHQVPVLSVRSGTGELKAIVFGYACHATVMAGQEWSGDYPGFAQNAIEEKHPGTVALFVAGCGADQNPLPRRTVELASRYGTELAAGVEAVLQAPMTDLRPTARTAYREIDLDLSELPSREQLVKDSGDANKYIAARAKTLLLNIDKVGSLRATYPYPVQTWHLGNDLTWISLGGEVVVDYSLRLKKELGPVWVAGYCNDVMAYIPSLRVLKEGGYEGATSMVYYGLPTVWSPRVEESIITEVCRQVDSLQDKGK